MGWSILFLTNFTNSLSFLGSAFNCYAVLLLHWSKHVHNCCAVLLLHWCKRVHNWHALLLLHWRKHVCNCHAMLSLHWFKHVHNCSGMLSLHWRVCTTVVLCCSYSNTSMCTTPATLAQVCAQLLLHWHKHVHNCLAMLPLNWFKCAHSWCAVLSLVVPVYAQLSGSFYFYSGASIRTVAFRCCCNNVLHIFIKYLSRKSLQTHSKLLKQCY